MVDTDQKALNLTKLFFQVPDYRTTLAYLAVVGFVFGVTARLLSGSGNNEGIVSTLLYGGADGVLLLAAPALIAALLATFLLSRKEFRQGLKYFVFISLVAAVVYGITILAGILAGIFLPGRSLFNLGAFFVVANALVLIIWLAACWIALAYRRKSLFLCWFHPFANIAFIVLWDKFRVFESSLSLGYSAYLAVFKLAIASGVFVLAALALVFIINAPSKRNFGISTLDVATMFFAQWVNGSKGLEDILSETEEVIQTPVTVTAFYNRRGKVKASFIVPQIHYGPIGNLGGSEFPGLLAEKFSALTSAPAFIFKGTANHDFDPVRSSSLRQIEAACGQCFKDAKKNQVAKAALVEGKQGNSSVFGFATGGPTGSVFLTLSRAPENSEDIHQSLGRALRNQALVHGFQEASIIDRHNCKVDNSYFGPGSIEYNEYEQAIRKIKITRETALRLGVSSSKLFGIAQGIGKGGVKAAILEAGGKRACFLVVDANNCMPQFREKLVKELHTAGKFDFADILTTDTHAVNSISGVHNPLGARVNWDEFASEARKAVQQAEANLEPCTIGIGSRYFEIEVLGPQRSSEMIITVNSIVAVLKILAPIIFAGSILMAFIALLLVK